MASNINIIIPEMFNCTGVVWQQLKGIYTLINYRAIIILLDAAEMRNNNNYYYYELYIRIFLDFNREGNYI